MSYVMGCWHPPRQWHTGVLMPCADPGCGDGAPGDFFKVVDDNGIGSTFRRRSWNTAEGRKFQWEVMAVKEPPTPRKIRETIKVKKGQPYPAWKSVVVYRGKSWDVVQTDDVKGEYIIERLVKDDPGDGDG